jgi:hypothetical protein
MTKTWSNIKYITNGPQVHQIIEKGLQVFPCLPSTEARDVVDFYDRLHDVGLAHLLPTTNFDSIVLHLGHVGLYPPGLGNIKFRVSSKGMLELIPFLIPPTLSNNVNAAISAVKSTSKNGYEMLWHILRLFVPGFDGTISANIPSWTDDTDIFDFSKDFILYFRLQ